MAAQNPPYVLQAGSHPAELFRRALKALAPFGGVVAPGDLAVTANGTPNMSVNVAAGEAVVHGTENTAQGSYYVRNDATLNLSIAASDPTNPRNDLVVAKVQDAAYSGAVNAWSLVVVTGTPAASPVDPATPANAIVLARVRVDAAVASIVAGKITDLRSRATARGGSVVCTSTTRPSSPTEGMEIYETDTDRVLVHTGAAWVQRGLTTLVPAARIRASANQSITGDTKVAFDTTVYDTAVDGSQVDLANERLVCKRAGLYAVTGQITWDASASGVREVRLQKNAAVDQFTGWTKLPPTPSEGMSIQASADMSLAVNDFVEVFARSTTTPINLLGSGTHHVWLSWRYIGPAA